MICKMIIKAIRFRTKSNSKRLIDHLNDGTENEAVCFLRGTSADLTDMHKDAISKSSSYAIRHWIIAPHEPISRKQMAGVVEMIAAEFLFDPKRAVIVEHKKVRATSTAADTHWHLLVGEVDPVSGKVLPCSFDRIIHELIARFSEYRFGHKFTQGKHTKAVINGLRRRGASDVAEMLNSTLIDTDTVPRESFTHAQHQQKKRLGINLPHLKQIVKSAVDVSLSRTDLGILLADASLVVAAGEKPNTWIVNTMDGILVGSLARLSGKRKAEIELLMMGSKNDTSDTKTNNTGSDIAGYSCDPQSSGALQKFADAKCRDDASSPGSDLGLSRTASGSDRKPDAEDRSAEIRGRSTKEWMKMLDRYQDQVSILLARANAAAMTPIERITAALWEMEQGATFNFHRNIGDFKKSEKSRSLEMLVRDLGEDLAKSRSIYFDAEAHFLKGSKPKWWEYMLGLTFVTERRIRGLKKAVEDAAHQVKSCERALQTAIRDADRTDRLERECHSKLVRDIDEKKRDAGPTLKMVETAQKILLQQPSLANCGLEFVLSRAKRVGSRLQSSERPTGAQHGYTPRVMHP